MYFPPFHTIYVVNLYNGPRGFLREGKAVSAICNSELLIRKRTLWMGDFNLHHADWDEHTTNITQQAYQLAEWVANIGGSYALESGTVTHAQGGSLDLIISSRQMTKEVYQCYIDPNADTTSDHEAIITEIVINRQHLDKNHLSKFQFKKLYEKVFQATLLAKSDLVKASLERAQAAPKSTPERQSLIDYAAHVLVQAIHSSLPLSTPRVLRAGGGEPWWNGTCQDVVQKVRNYRREIQLEEEAGIDNPRAGEKLKTLRNNLRKQVKISKKKYYQDVINGLTNKTIFKL